jgi:hypothetical protein
LWGPTLCAKEEGCQQRNPVNDIRPSAPTGVLDGGTYVEETQETREIHGGGLRNPTDSPRGSGRAAVEVGEAHSSVEAG